MVKLEDMIESTKIEKKTLFIKLKDGKEIVVGRGQRGILGKDEEDICYKVVTPRYILDGESCATNLVTGEECGIYFCHDIKEQIKEHYKNDPMMEAGSRLRDLESGIKQSFKKTEKVRPWKMCAFMGLATAAYPLTVAYGFAYLLKTKNPFAGFLVLENAISSPYLFAKSLKEVVSPSRKKEVIDWNLIKTNPSKNSLGIRMCDQHIEGFDKYENSIYEICTPDDENYEKCEYFFTPEKAVFDEFTSTKERFLKAEKEKGVLFDSVYRTELKEYLAKSKLYSVI
jgi:hypothetical protein